MSLQCRHPSHTTQACLWFLTRGNERTDIWGRLILCLFLQKTKPFFQFPTTDRCSSTTGTFIHTYFNKEHAIANGVLRCRTARAWLSLAQTHLPRGKRCALNLAGDTPAATGQPRSSYEETVHIVNPDLSHWAESALQLHKGCTAFSRNYNCKGAPAE